MKQHKSYMVFLGHRIKFTVWNLATRNGMEITPSFFSRPGLYSYFPAFLWSISPWCENINLLFSHKHDTTYSVSLRYESDFSCQKLWYPTSDICKAWRFYCLHHVFNQRRWFWMQEVSCYYIFWKCLYLYSTILPTVRSSPYTHFKKGP